MVFVRLEELDVRVRESESVTLLSVNSSPSRGVVNRLLRLKSYNKDCAEVYSRFIVASFSIIAGRCCLGEQLNEVVVIFSG